MEYYKQVFKVFLVLSVFGYGVVLIANVLDTPPTVLGVIISLILLYYLKESGNKKARFYDEFPYQKILDEKIRNKKYDIDTLNLEGRLIKIKGRNTELMILGVNELFGEGGIDIYNKLSRNAIEYLEQNYKVKLPVALSNHPRHNKIKSIASRVEETIVQNPKEPIIVEDRFTGDLLKVYFKDIYGDEIQYEVYEGGYTYIEYNKPYKFFPREVKSILESVDGLDYKSFREEQKSKLKLQFELKGNDYRQNKSVKVILEGYEIGYLEPSHSEHLFCAINQNLEITSEVIYFELLHPRNQIKISIKVNHKEK